MEKNIKICLLYDFYSQLLTDRQSDMIDMYYNRDFSLAEIANDLGITRQAVRDSIKKAENTLYSMDSKLNLVDRFLRQEKTVRQIMDRLSILQKGLKKGVGYDRIKNEFDGIRSSLKDIIKD